MAKSIRLNKEMRETILNNISVAYDKANPSPELTITKEVELKPLDKYVRAEYKKRAAKVEKAIAENPILESAVNREAAIRFVTPTGSWERVIDHDKDGNGIRQFLSKFVNIMDFRNFENTEKSAACIRAIEQHNQLKRDARKERAALSAWELDKSKYMEQCRQIIYGVNTTAQLVEVWEEVAQFIPTGYRNPSNIALPAVNVKALNDKLFTK